MNTTTRHPLIPLPLIALAAALATPFATPMRAQPITITTVTTAPTVDFNGAQVPRTADASIDYIIDDTGALTFASTGQMSTGAGGVFHANSAPYHFSATMGGANKAGTVVFNGSATPDLPSFSASNRQGAAFSMTGSAGGSYVTIIGGTTSTGVTGTIQNYWATASGGVVWMATAAAGSNLTWKNLEVTNNGISPATYGSTASNGGVIHVVASAASPGNLAFENVTFRKNTNSSSSTGMGGVIYMQTNVTMTGTNVAFIGNSIKATTTGAGGAIYANSSSPVTLTNALFSSNTATGPLGGGAVYVQGASILTINGGTFANNIVTGNVAGTAGGGGIYNNASIVNLTDVVFISNTANALGAGTQGRGGAIYVGGGTLTYIANDNITNIGNTANAASSSANPVAAPANGGFLMYGGNNCLANFNIAPNKTLTIGSAASLQQDTIASGGANAFHVISINPHTGYSGTIVLNSDNSNYTSVTTVENGALLLGHENALFSGYTIDIAAGARFGGAGSLVITGSYAPLLTVKTGGIFQVGYTRLAAQTFTFSGSLALAANAVLDFGIYGSNNSDKLVITDGTIPLAPAAGPFNSTLNLAGPVTLNLSALTSGSYNLINMPAGITARSNITLATLASTFTVTSGGSQVTPSAYTLGIDAAGTNLYITINTDAIPPAAPDTSSSAASSITTTGFTANWPAVTGATGYLIDVATDPSFATVTLVAGYNNLPVTGNSYAITGLTPGVTYYYRVRAVNAGGPSANSLPVTVTTTPDTGSTTTLVNDTLDDTDRIGGQDGSSTTTTAPSVSTPTATNTQWVASVAGTPSNLIARADGTHLTWTPSTTSASLVHAYMPDWTVASGQTVTLTLRIKTGAFGATVNNFRMAVFNDAAPANRARFDGAPVTANGANVTGYGFFSAAGTFGGGGTANLDFNINKRTTLSSTNMLNTAADWTTITGATVTNPDGYFDANTDYTITYKFAYDGANLTITLGIDGGAYSNYTKTVTDTSGTPNLAFNALVLRLGGGSAQFAKINFNSLTVTTGATPSAPQPPPAPVATAATDITGSSFTANWTASTAALDYLIDVATDTAFTSILATHNALATGNTLSAPVTGLTLGTTYYYRLRALNANGGSTYSNTITVTTAPPVTVTPTITSPTTATTTAGMPFTYTITAINTDATTTYAATNLPATLTLNTATGEITGTTVPADAGTHTVTLTATNVLGSSPPVTLTLTINPAPTTPPIITGPTAVTGTQGAAFTYQINASDAPMSYALATGTLPVGLTLNNTTGLISGTPTATGASTVTLTSTNYAGTSAPFTLAITIVPPVPAITSPLTAAGTAGVAFQYQIAASNTPTAYALATGTLPAGLTLNTTTGLISGTPAAAGTHTVGLTATNAGGSSPVANLVITIAPALCHITSPLAAGGMTGIAFTYQAAASNSPASFTATGLPAGLALNPATGLITGTPAVFGAFNITLAAVNTAAVAGPASTLVLNIVPLAVPTITSAPHAAAMAGMPFNFQVTALNNPAFTATGLPAGLALNPATGLITGTPATSGVYIVTLTATNIYTAAVQQFTITIDGKSTLVTLAGSAGSPGSANGASTAARFNTPTGAVTDPSGNLYIADTGNNTIRRIAPNGQVTTLDLAGLNAPSALALSPDAATLYIADAGNDAIKALTLATGALATLPITGLDAPTGLATDPDGNLYIANTGASAIIKIAAPAGAQTTLAGIPGSAGTIDGAGSAACFNLPTGLAVSPDGSTLYVADTANSTIRAIDLYSRQVTTIAGAPQQPGSANGPPDEARFNTPQALAVDATGNIYVADTGNDTLRKIAVNTNIVTTIAGTPGLPGSANGSGPQARLNAPAGITIDAEGDIYIADTQNNTIRVLQMAPMIHEHPASRTVKPGAPVSFTVLASGAPTPTYKWAFGATTLASATTSAYDIATATTADAGTYTVTVTNAAGTVTSAPATLTISATTTTPPPPPPPSSSGGGGGAPSLLFLLALATLAALRNQRKK